MSTFSTSFVVLVWSFTVITTLIVWSLNFVGTKYTIPEITYFMCYGLLSTRYIRLATFKILGQFFFTILGFCEIVFISYGNCLRYHQTCVDSFIRELDSYGVVFTGFNFSFLFFLTFFCLVS